MPEPIQSIHHISAIVGNPQENYDFYRHVLGLRLIKQTVNFDDPSVYHLYFSDQKSDPTFVLTFFPWDNQKTGNKGGGQPGRIAFAIPNGTIDYWKNILHGKGVTFTESTLFGNIGIEFSDPHQLDLALVETDQESDNPDIYGFYGLILQSHDYHATKRLLLDKMGALLVHETQAHLHFELTGRDRQRILLAKQSLPLGQFGIGTVHHVAWAVSSPENLEKWRHSLKEKAYSVTPVKDRKYFKSIYLKENGGIVFEFASLGPGFTVDEPFDQLGGHLQLPEQYENRRLEIKQHLPPLQIN